MEQAHQMEGAGGVHLAQLSAMHLGFKMKSVMWVCHCGSDGCQKSPQFGLELFTVFFWSFCEISL